MYRALHVFFQSIFEGFFQSIFEGVVQSIFEGVVQSKCFLGHFMASRERRRVLARLPQSRLHGSTAYAPRCCSRSSSQRWMAAARSWGPRRSGNR